MQLARSLLDGAEPVDSAARQAIDARPSPRSTDPVLHAAALWLAFSAGAELRLGRSHARGWIPGVHELIDSGHLDAAAYALPRLKVTFPQMPYLEYHDLRLSAPACRRSVEAGSRSWTTAAATSRS